MQDQAGQRNLSQQFEIYELLINSFHAKFMQIFIVGNQKLVKIRSGYVAQSTKYLPCKHKNLKLILEHTTKPDMVASTCNSRTGLSGLSL